MVPYWSRTANKKITIVEQHTKPYVVSTEKNKYGHIKNTNKVNENNKEK